MKNDVVKSENLQEENNILREKVSDLATRLTSKEDKISELELLIKWYQERLRLDAHKKYGASCEQSQGEQLGFFDEAEITADRKASEPDIEEITYIRKKRVGKREEDFSALPVETVTHELPQSEQVCAECGEQLHVMGKEIRKELVIIPAQVKVKEHIRYVYSCRNCEKTKQTVSVVKAPMPEPVIKGSAASPSAVAHIMTQKYVTYPSLPSGTGI